MTTPEGSMPPLHVHDEDESFYVLDGVITLYVGDQVVTLDAGRLVPRPAGRPAHVRRRVRGRGCWS